MVSYEKKQKYEFWVKWNRFDIAYIYIMTINSHFNIICCFTFEFASPFLCRSHNVLPFSWTNFCFITSKPDKGIYSNIRSLVEGIHILLLDSVMLALCSIVEQYSNYCVTILYYSKYTLSFGWCTTNIVYRSLLIKMIQRNAQHGKKSKWTTKKKNLFLSVSVGVLCLFFVLGAKYIRYKKRLKHRTEHKGSWERNKTRPFHDVRGQKWYERKTKCCSC